MNPRQQEISAALARFAHEELLQGQGADLTVDTPILELGILDSLSMVTVLGFIDEQYGVRIPEDRIVPRHFATLSSIAELVLELERAAADSGEPLDELAQLVRLQESYGLRSVRIETSDGRATYHSLQTDGSEPAWLVLPALGNPSTSLAPVMRTLAGKQRVIALDLCGFGLSSADNDAPTLADHVDATLSLLELLPEQLILIGSSASAMIATEVARRAPARVRGLVITGFGLIADPPAWWTDLKQLSRTPKRFLEAAYHTPPELTSALERILGDVLARPAYESFLDGGGLQAMESTFDGIEVPTLFVGGEHDDIIGRSAIERAHARVAGSRLEWIARCGHFPPVERPEPFIWYVRDFHNSLASPSVTSTQ